LKGVLQMQSKQIQSTTQTRRSGVLAIHSVDEFVFSVPDLKEAIHYYESFGLVVKPERLNNEPCLGLYTDHHHHRWARIIETGTKKRLQWVTYGVYAEDLEPFRAHLKDCSVEFCSALDQDSSGDGCIWFKHPDGLTLQLRVAEKTSPSSTFERNFPPPSTDHGRAPNGSKVPLVRPAHLSHLLMFSPAVNRAQSFYEKVLGLRLSDSAGDNLIAFMHSPHGSDHHLIALFTSSDYGLHHSSWAVRSIDEVGHGMKQMAKAGYDQGWGVGRHVLGSNYFRYVKDPWGSYCEYSFDIDFIPHTLDWPSANHPPEDSLYVWGPDVPEDFVKNYEIA
jgi:catechol 2,3-dioxygenase-like lactoylglutathione lyase family enzyme